MLRTHQQQHQQQEFNRIFCELSSFILNTIRSSPSPELSSCEVSPVTYRLPPMTAGGFAAMLMGASLMMMLCGSLTFFIGFMLMPWVIGLVMVLYVVGVWLSVLMIWRSVLCYGATSLEATRKEGPAWKLL